MSEYTYHIGEIDGCVAIYHREPAPFEKFGTRRVVDAWCASERVAWHLLDDMKAERAAMTTGGSHDAVG